MSNILPIEDENLHNYELRIMNYELNIFILHNSSFLFSADYSHRKRGIIRNWRIA